MDKKLKIELLELKKQQKKKDQKKNKNLEKKL